MERTHLNRSAAGIPSPSRPPVAAPIGLGELAAAYSNGTLNGPAFLASVNRVIALRQSLK